MKEDVKNLWVEALRSGKYQQAKHALRWPAIDTFNFCCLGVLCDLSGVGTWEDEGYRCGQEVRDIELPEAVMRFAGISTDVVDVPRLRVTLMGENDRGKTFPEIADIIEQHWQEL